MNDISDNVVYLRTLPEAASLLHRASYVMRWGDMDAFGHLNNAMYFTYFEQIRVDWLASLGEEHELVLANVSCTFLQALKFPATVELELYGGPPREHSMDSYYLLRSADDDSELCAIGHGTIVWYDQQSQRAIPVPSVVVNCL
ncbi:hypothetical protein MNBD_GAMMA15-499 [hydrothermal vent metagenome]|uniref:Uncharacterized protein n=1 Tax=hydrothermal vent metagenome TaxID=652676 RepID=A0A3B0YIK5_9ZZZZ